jgi:hypothetical protein
MFPTLQCRSCMRKLHQHDPLHRIECWTGKYFRAAAMWEVGGYILIRHRGDIGLCETLKFQQDVVDGIQERQDILDQDTCRALEAATAAATHAATHAATAAAAEPNNDNDPCGIQNTNQYLLDKKTDDLILMEMDRLHAQRQKDDEDISVEDMLREDDEDDEKECADESFTEFEDYLKSNTNGTATTTASAIPGVQPEKDAFNNHYIRIAHTNGIHHLAVITCTCRGVDNLPSDLMYSRLVPTSFIRIRTLFTTMALDTFRLANLEMKASAYQYFQLIHRLTSKTAANVPNLYHDLRKLSRAWRWMKKLKWAGYGQKTADPMKPAAGELNLFCPACPQPNVNLPADWKTDPNRYLLFQR